jgi:hypothetical protein
MQNQAAVGMEPMRCRKRAARCCPSLLAALVLLPISGRVLAGEDLGGYPVCEASAAVIVPCPVRPDFDCLLVGDNEESQALFLYELDYGLNSGRVDLASRRVVDIGDLLTDQRAGVADARGELSDIEALTRLASGEILVYGSHGRNKKCERKKKRRRHLGLRLEPDGALAGRVRLVQVRKMANLADTFGSDPSGLLAEVADVVRAAEQDADAGHCEAAFNIEGAATSPARGKNPRESVWIGLRSPLVRGNAVLARHDPTLGQLHFDAIRLLDLGGEGIRGLSIAGGYVWGLSASPGHAEHASHRLWRFPSDALAGDDRDRVIKVESVAEVPPRSEGLAISAEAIFVVADGKVGDGTCRQASSHVVLPRPPEGGGHPR